MALLTHLRSICNLLQSSRLTTLSKVNFHVLLKKQLVPEAPQLGRRGLFWKKPSQRDIKVADNVPDEFELIYRNGMIKYIFRAKLISIISGGLVITGLIINNDYNKYEDSFSQWNPSARSTENENIVYIAIFFTLLVLIQLIISKMPLRIYKIPKNSKYISVSYGNFFFGKAKCAYERGQIIQMEETGFLPWKNNRFVIKSNTDIKTVILLEQYFRRPADLYIMTGEQNDPNSD